MRSATAMLLIALCVVSISPSARESRSSLSGGELLEKCRHAVDILDDDSRSVRAYTAAQSAYYEGLVEVAAEAESLLGALDVQYSPRLRHVLS